MNDFKFIKVKGKDITPEFLIKEHDLFIEFLLTKYDEPFDGKTVVITHHSPGNELRRKGYRGDRTGFAYFADIEEIIGYHNVADLWVHGHIHRNWDYMINKTHVVANPYGYYNKATNGEFNPNLIIEL